ncbi:Nucleolar GTP-binding protein 1 [Cardamine amara subsp. amara]|uniref:Nucleolar GTP-binding protein 1 n=1 Tax=Cardamine amara subsp. amara TaxID=228776 RepID=A0ABD1B0X8_CARAN
MVQYDFKNISVIPIGNEFVDVILSNDQRQIPNFLRKGLNINHLRKLYTSKVKNTELTFHDKLSTIINEFPDHDEIHPLYSDLLGLVFDRDHYKLALCQVNTSRHLITKIAKDYVKLLEFGESLKQCQTLKVRAIRRMFSVIDEITPSLAYLEMIRQHMLKLPMIDPNTPTLFICGYPNVDKTCFMNTGAADDNFTTKSVAFDVGHTDYKGSRYQVIDAPWILDKSIFGDCNVMAALVRHLSAALVLFFMDVSGSCGYSIAHQATRVHSLKSLFVNKPLVVVCDENDLMQISEQDWKLIEEITSSSGMGGKEEGYKMVLKISNLKTEEGVLSAKSAACEKLLDGRDRLSCIAEGLRNKYILARQEWKDDISPQADLDYDPNASDLLVDSDVLFRLEECEEGLKKAEEEEEDFVMVEDCFKEVQKGQVVAIRKIQPLRILIAFVFFILVGNTYGVIQEYLSALSF